MYDDVMTQQENYLKETVTMKVVERHGNKIIKSTRIHTYTHTHTHTHTRLLTITTLK